MATDCLLEAQKTLREGRSIFDCLCGNRAFGLDWNDLSIVYRLGQLGGLLKRTQELLKCVDTLNVVHPSQEIQQLLKDVEYARKQLTQMAGANTGSNGGLAYLAEAITLVELSTRYGQED